MVGITKDTKDREEHEGFYCLALNHRDHGELRDHRGLLLFTIGVMGVL